VKAFSLDSHYIYYKMTVPEVIHWFLLITAQILENQYNIVTVSGFSYIKRALANELLILQIICISHTHTHTHTAIIMTAKLYHIIININIHHKLPLVVDIESD
jgi:hypothetical protein